MSAAPMVDGLTVTLAGICPECVLAGLVSSVSITLVNCQDETGAPIAVGDPPPSGETTDCQVCGSPMALAVVGVCAVGWHAQRDVDAYEAGEDES